MDVKVKQIREKLKTDILIHEKTLKKYKKAHKICYFIQLVLNMSTVAGARRCEQEKQRDVTRARRVPICICPEVITNTRGVLPYISHMAMCRPIG